MFRLYCLSRMKNLKVSWFLWFQALLFVAAAIVVYYLISNLGFIIGNINHFLRVISPLIAGSVIAYFLNSPCNLLEKVIKKSGESAFLIKRARGLSVLIVYLSATALLSLLGSYLFPFIAQNVLDFIDLLPQLYRDAEAWAYGIQWGYINEIFNTEEAVRSVFDNFSTANLLGHITSGLNSISGFALSLTVGIIDAVVALVLSIYILLYKELIFAITDRIARLFMKEQRLKTVKVYLLQANELFYKFIKAQFIDACVLGILATILLAVLNVRFAVALGFLLGVCNMIPKFGSIFGSVVVILLAFITGGVTQGILTAILLTGLQQIDAHIIGPKIMGDVLQINPILVFVALIVGGAYFGVIGMFLSIPVAAMLKITFINIVEARESKVQRDTCKTKA